jgi:hypothetical protein
MTTRKTTTKRNTGTKTVDDVATEVKNATPEDDKTKKVRAARKARAVADSAELSIEKVTQSLTKAGLDEQVKKDVAIITNKMKSDFETQAKITKLEFEGEKRMLEHDNKILKSLVAAKDTEIDKLRAALDKKDSEVKEVAVAAMEAQSGKAALAAVQEHAQSTSSKK